MKTKTKMFAIQSGTCFLKPRQLFDQYALFDLTVSAKPKIYKKKEDAARMLDLSIRFMNESIVRSNELVIEHKAEVAKNKQKLVSVINALAKLKLQPYQDVKAKIERLDRTMRNVKENSMDYSGHYNQIAKRFKQILQTKPKVVLIKTVLATGK